jgi:uncharacterized protein (DUF2267 family)
MPDQAFRKNVPEIDHTEIEDSRVKNLDPNGAFLEKVMANSGIADPYDARDITEVIYRVMRDLMPTETSDRVGEELHEEIYPTKEKALNMEISELWRDTNPLVRFLSRIRPPLKGPGWQGITSDLFLTRVANEGGLAPHLDRDRVIMAVFSATKDELSPERIEEITGWLPDRVQQMWIEA